MYTKYRKFLSLIVAVALFMSVFVTVGTVPVSAATGSMNIYGIYLKCNSGEGPSSTDEPEYGDAVLVESRGQYMLMDTGNSYVSKSVLQFLKAKGVKKMSIYISHLHGDHFFGMEQIAEDGSIKVDKLYLPSRNVGKDYTTKNGGNQANQLSRAQSFFPDAKVIYLQKGSTFTLGDIKAEVLGPVSNIPQSKFRNDSNGEQSGHYLNNQSLTTMMTCGGVKYLTTGDIESKENQPNYSFNLEEEALVKTYGSKLRADILKVSHHGVICSTSASFAKAVKAKYCFASNPGYEKPIKASSGNIVSRAYTPLEHLNKYGLVYLIGNEKAAVHISVKDGKITMKKAPISNGAIDTSQKAFNGWVDLYGNTQTSSGKYNGKNHYYLKNGKLYTGIHKINGKYYNFGNGVATLQGVYTYNAKKKKWVYGGFRNLGTAKKKKLAYFYKPDSKGRAAAAIGFRKAKSDAGSYYYYFDKKKKGVRYEPAKGEKNSKGKLWKLKKIGKHKYLIKAKSGVVFNYGAKKSTFMSFGSKLRAFTKKGRMITGKAKVQGKTHTFDKKTGYMKK